jgi:hypothetical protein
MQFTENVQARPHTAQATQERIQELQWELLEHPPYSLDLAPTDIHLFGVLNNHLGGKRLADDDVETEVDDTTVKRLLCCGFWCTGKVMGQVYQCWWMICRVRNVFSRFRYHMFYVLYPFVTYLLNVPRNTPIVVHLHPSYGSRTNCVHIGRLSTLTYCGYKDDVHETPGVLATSSDMHSSELTSIYR